MRGVCVCGFVCSYIAVSLIQLAIASVIVHCYPCQEHLATLADELVSQPLTNGYLELVQHIDGIVQEAMFFLQ
jgi:hypothetical protein